MTAHRHRLGRFAAAALLTVTATTACGDKGDDDVETKAPEQATSQVKQYAETTRTAAGVDRFSQSSENVTPCEGRAGEVSNPDEVYYVQGIYQLMIPADQQADALAQVRQRWQGDGLTIKSERSFGPDGTGEIVAATDTGYSLSLTSGQPPAMLLLVSSPCYQR
jgi:hypothetical protein